MMNQPPLSEAVTRFKQAAEEILSTYEARKPAHSVQVTPAQIVDAIEQFLSITIRTDRQTRAVLSVLAVNKCALALEGGYGGSECVAARLPDGLLHQ